MTRPETSTVLANAELSFCPPPAGVSGVEVWVKVAPVSDPPPSDPAVLTFIALDTRTPYTLDFDGPDGGQNAHYMLRWVNTKGEKGPWSETATATIGA